MGGYNVRVNSLIFKDFLNELLINIFFGMSDMKCCDDVIFEMFWENVELLVRVCDMFNVRIIWDKWS